MKTKGKFEEQLGLTEAQVVVSFAVTMAAAALVCLAVAGQGFGKFGFLLPSAVMLVAILVWMTRTSGLNIRVLVRAAKVSPVGLPLVFACAVAAGGAMGSVVLSAAG